MTQRALFIFVVLLAIIFFISEYTKDNNPFPSVSPIEDETILQTYPDLYRAVLSRNASDLFSFTEHQHEQIRRQAWRALASTPVDSVDRLFNSVLESEDRTAWFALSRHELSNDQLQTIRDQWEDHPEQRAGISLVLGQQGDEESLSFLLSQIETSAGTSYEYQFALAVGRLMVAHPIETAEHRRILERAFAVSDHQITRAYLHGYYRGNAQELSPQMQSEVYQLWKSYGLGKSEDVDQYMLRIIPGRTLYEIALYYNSENDLHRENQLAIELAQTLADVELNDRSRMVASILVRESNPHVVQQTLAILEGRLDETENFFTYVRDDLLQNPSTGSFVWVQALQTAARVDSTLIDEHSGRLEEIQSANPYLLSQILDIWQLEESPEENLQRLEGIVQTGESLSVSNAINSLNSYWQNLQESENVSESLREQARQIVFNALELGDRGVAYGAAQILGSETLFNTDDFDRINQTLSAFELPEDIEVYQAFGALYRERFEQQAAVTIDSLAALENGPLNRSLAQAGWDVEAPEEPSTTFRAPDWELFPQLGEQPIWVLETDKGTIRVQMDHLTAPATVSAIDSLTRAGAYNGVPFHRVVPNFVIQGGDIERQDGFGGPDFIIPTEASEADFVRGAAGIASAGTDTEGSQYFFMHQWKPHLNGSYTLFGNVIEGMDVVDEIVVGDSVNVAYWE